MELIELIIDFITTRKKIYTIYYIIFLIGIMGLITLIA